MIRISNIHYRYPDANGFEVLRGIDLTVGKGEYLLLCGGSGSGKSTLGYLLNGLIPHFFGGSLEGLISILGRDTLKLTVDDLFSKVGLVFQNTDAQLFNSTVENEIAFGLESLGRSPREIESEIRRTAAAVGIEHLLSCSPEALSGGEKRLVAIASVLCLAPPVLVLDEPLAHLDRQGAKRVRRILRRLHRQGTTVVVIEQRVEAVLNDVTRCVVMDQGRILFDGPPKAAFPVLRNRHLLPLYPTKSAPEPTNDPADSEAESLLRLRNIHYEINHKTILHDVSLQVRSGEILAVVGPNGSGKTTLVRHFNGLLRPLGGHVVFMGKKIRRAGPSGMADRIGISFQNPNDQFFKTKVVDEIKIGLKLSPEEGEARFEELCTLFHLHELLDRSPYRLSEGQKKRVSVASILAMGPRLLVLDEPTVGQDGRFLEILAGLLLTLREKGVTIVVVTHDLEFAHAIACRWVVVYGGRVVGMGTPGELAQDESLIRMGALHPIGPFIPLGRQRDGRVKGDLGTMGVELPNAGTFGTKLDPRTKLALGSMGIVAILMTGETVLLAGALGLLCMGLFLFKLAGPWIRALKMLLPLVGLVFVISVISFDVNIALMLSLRLLDLLTLSFLFFHGMDPEDLGQSMRQMGLPYEFCFILTTSLRYVPFMGRKIRRIVDAQRSRGIDLRPRLRNVPHFAALLMPLLVQSFVLAEQLAMAMESRGFARTKRTFRKEYRISLLEYGSMGVALGLLVVYGVWVKDLWGE